MVGARCARVLKVRGLTRSWPRPSRARGRGALLMMQCPASIQHIHIALCCLLYVGRHRSSHRRSRRHDSTRRALEEEKV